MALKAYEKLTIKPERGESVTALFNPGKLSITKKVSWEKQKAKEQDVPELQFTAGEPRSLVLDLIFDTYDCADQTKESVVTKYTEKLFKLTLVEKDLHRPPVCELSWGKFGGFFKGVLESVDQTLTLFTEDGTPVRATCKCTFMEGKPKAKGQGTRSADVAKTHTVRRGDTLSSIAAKAYLDPGLWRPIAERNGIDDPRQLRPGMVLLIPSLTGRYSLQGRS